MGLFRSHKVPAFTLMILVCFIGLSVFLVLTVYAGDEKTVSRSEKTTAPAPPEANPLDPNTASAVNEKPNRPAAAEETPPDPNELSAEDGDESDIFALDLSALDVIYEAYRNIFTPKLVTEDGRVRYSTLKRKPLDRIAAKRELKELNPAILMSLPREERIAFWINTYNFCTLQVILDHYPIQPKWWNILYPDNSIMQITGAWKKIFFDIQREEYSLKEIEQDFLLKRYKDPRICFALSNASVGGAILRNEPYEGSRLDEQLNDQVKKYLATDRGIRWDRDNNILYLSNLFQVHESTFLASKYARIKKFRDRPDNERAWLNFILPYLSKEDIRYLETTPFRIKFIEVDWHLNEIR